ncbi:hypothetical protein K7X08_012051 [Anisodus acutangulus]|uniref:NAC domain-containing protein n=1 Tax=Anisodus acutangulus TaxID=402998 RepID=A0A9Q1LC49_9SOLA|nr:hypothetical protein K7X08_012051 [Anisodus acutangulus]
MTCINIDSLNNVPSSNENIGVTNESPKGTTTRTCPSCGHLIKSEEKAGIHNLPGLPAGVKFDPSDQEILEHLEAKVILDAHKLHPLIDEFIQTLEGENGICYTHPEKLPGVTKDGLFRHFFHRPSKAYTTGPIGSNGFVPKVLNDLLCTVTGKQIALQKLNDSRTKKIYQHTDF